MPRTHPIPQVDLAALPFRELYHCTLDTGVVVEVPARNVEDARGKALLEAERAGLGGTVLRVEKVEVTS